MFGAYIVMLLGVYLTLVMLLMVALWWLLVICCSRLPYGG
jgi:hypothetical protein